MASELRPGQATDLFARLDALGIAHATVNFHPLRNDQTTHIAAADLLVFARAEGHVPVL